MPELTRNGAVIHWEQEGDGRRLLVCTSMISMPSDFEALLSELASDHRIVTYDPRGAGRSSRTGPYDITTDADDMAAVIEEAGRSVVAVSLGYNPVPLAVVTRRPELVDGVVLVSSPRLGSREGAEDVVLFESDAVVEVMLDMMESDPPGLLRTIIRMGNPQLSDAGVRERVEQQLAYGPPAVGVERGKAYLAYDATDACAELGRRLWIIQWESPLASPDARKRVRQRLPEARFFEVEDGPISRPDLTAEIVRKAAHSLGGRT
jgi:pimeloyl-ACP methyl ester carboxylesterase